MSGGFDEFPYPSIGSLVGEVKEVGEGDLDCLNLHVRSCEFVPRVLGLGERVVEPPVSGFRGAN